MNYLWITLIVVLHRACLTDLDYAFVPYLKGVFLWTLQFLCSHKSVTKRQVRSFQGLEMSRRNFAANVKFIYHVYSSVAHCVWWRVSNKGGVQA